MQSEDQPVSDSNSPIQSNLREDWPPKLLRLVMGAVFTAVLGYIVLKNAWL